MNPNPVILKLHLPKIFYPLRILIFLAIIILPGAFLSILVTGTGVNDGFLMGKVFLFAQWMLLVILVGQVFFLRDCKQPARLLWFEFKWQDLRPGIRRKVLLLSGETPMMVNPAFIQEFGMDIDQ